MKLQLILLLALLLSLQAGAQRISQSDSIWLSETFTTIELNSVPLSIIGKQFIGTPYVAHTLDQGKTERLTIDFAHLDCTTFVENCVALATLEKNSTSEIHQIFCTNLQELRYRNGKVNGYTSRIHYFSEWIIHAEAAGRIHNISKLLSDSIYTVEVNFMSTHPNRYPKLKENKTLISAIAKQENTINGTMIPYIPIDIVSKVEDQLPEGSIVALCTNIKGLDITHVGIITKVNGHSHLLHASSLQKKVVVSDVPLSEYLSNSTTCSGIVALEVRK